MKSPKNPTLWVRKECWAKKKYKKIPPQGLIYIKCHQTPTKNEQKIYSPFLFVFVELFFYLKIRWEKWIVTQFFPWFYYSKVAITSNWKKAMQIWWLFKWIQILVEFCAYIIWNQMHIVVAVYMYKYTVEHEKSVIFFRKIFT